MAEKLNGPGFGFRMAAAGQQVSTGDVARQAIERLTADSRRAVAVMGELGRAAAELQEHLLEVLSYCETKTEETEGGARYAYRDVADRLRAILDGE